MAGEGPDRHARKAVAKQRCMPLLSLRRRLRHRVAWTSNQKRVPSATRYRLTDHLTLALALVQIKDIPRLAERIKCFIFSRTYKATHAKVGGREGAAKEHNVWESRSAFLLQGKKLISAPLTPSPPCTPHPLPSLLPPASAWSIWRLCGRRAASCRAAPPSPSCCRRCWSWAIT